MFFFTMFVLAAIFLVGTFSLTAISSALRRLQRKEVANLFKELGSSFFYRPAHLYFFPKYEFEGIFFATICALNISRFCYAAAALLLLSQTSWFGETVLFTEKTAHFDWAWVLLVLSIVAFILVAFVLADYLPRVLGTRFPKVMLRLSAPLASPFLFLAFPVTYFFLKASRSLSHSIYLDSPYGPMGKEEIIDMLHRAEFGPSFDVHDRKLIESVLTFKERIAREVMVPRVDVFSLSAETSIKEAAQKLQGEGYSRTPIYRNTVDNIVGVLMHKDLLNKYVEYEQKGNDLSVLAAPIETIQKSILHTPETKKLSSLLQEFRKKQVHLAIVVDEYGGTEGIVTIEDILEEIVGEIADEYDQAEQLYFPQSDGSWVVDARMNILDAEEDLGIKIPQEGEYDTIGGYIYHTTGMIPAKGFVIHQDQFDMEILESNDRSVERVKIKPVASSDRRNIESSDLTNSP